LGTLLQKKNLGKTNVTFTELEAWCISKLQIPHDIHQPFVIGYDINVDEDKPEFSTFHVSISTRFLQDL
jgi:hypothetical protein